MKDFYLTQDIEGRLSVESEPPPGLKQIWFSFRGGMEMDPESYEWTVKALEELVGLRNDLVHHLLENFNLWTLQGCAAADAHLDQSYERIDRHVLELGGWARSMDEAARLTAGFMATDEFIDLALSTSTANTPVLDANAPIVECLRQAHAALAVQGWTLLDDAMALITRTTKDQVPKRYGCTTWRQVLSRSGVFELKRQPMPQRKGLFTAYRIEPSARTASAGNAESRITAPAISSSSS